MTKYFAIHILIDMKGYSIPFATDSNITLFGDEEVCSEALSKSVLTEKEYYNVELVEEIDAQTAYDMGYDPNESIDPKELIYNGY